MDRATQIPAPRAAAPGRVLVTGAAGLVGEEVCRQLVDAGWPVRALVRNTRRPSGTMPPTIEITEGDVRDDAALRAACSGCDGVVHLAAIAIERRGQTYESVNTGATLKLLDAAAATGVRRFVMMSQNGADARSPSRFLQSKGLAEDAVRQSPLEWTVLRPSVIFGPKDEFVNVLARLARITPGVMPLPDGGRARFQPIAVRDVATAVVRTLERSDAVQQTYPLGGPEELSLREMTERILRAMEVRRAIIGIPRFALRPVVALMQRVLPNPPVTTTLLDLLGQDNVVRDNRVQELGIQPVAFSPSELGYLRGIGIREAIRAFMSR